MIEGVLVLVPTFALIFAFIDFGLMFYRWNTLQNAVREGARYAITFDTDMDPHNGPQSGQSQSAAIKQVVERYSMGIVHAADSPASITVRYCPQNNPTVWRVHGKCPWEHCGGRGGLADLPVAGAAERDASEQQVHDDADDVPRLFVRHFGRVSGGRDFGDPLRERR
ncbi:MAG: TadE family protein [Acidobacteriota bacterium]